MIETALLLMGIASLILASAILYAIIISTPLVKEFLAIWKNKNPQIIERPMGNALSGLPSPMSAVKNESAIKRVADIPPEVLAPALKNPPKVAGGFGKKVDE